MKRLLYVPIIILLIIGMVVFLPKTAEVNLSTGTIRYCLGGIPYRYWEMDRLSREWQDLKCPTVYLRIAEYPTKNSNNPDSMLRGLMMGIGVWSKSDKSIAKLMAIDLENYITSGMHGLPSSYIFYSDWFVDQKRESIRTGNKFDKEIFTGEIGEMVKEYISSAGL